MTFANGWPLGNLSALRDVDHRWLKKLQSDSDGRLQVAYLDVSGALDPRTGGVAGFSSWDEERARVDMFWGTSDMPYADLPIQRALRWYVFGTDIVGALRVSNRLQQEFPEIEAEFAKLNLKRLCGFAGVGINIQTREIPVRTLADLAGLNLSFTGTSYEVFERLGAVEVEVHQGEEYSAVADGRADGTLGYTEFLLDFPDSEVVRYTTLLNMPFPSHDFYGMNLSRWNSLPAELRAVFEESAEWFYDVMTNAQLQLTHAAADRAVAAGHEFINLSSADQDRLFELMSDVAHVKAAQLDEEGLPGTDILRRTRQLIETAEM